MMRYIQLDSPAKINLLLDVVGKRDDGYHDIVTVFEKINLKDTLILTKLARNEIKITSKSKDIPLDKNNLVYKAAELIKNNLQINKGVKIDIRKRIPVAAGLGGGSSNAAMALLGLNRLWRLGLKKKDLVSLAKKLGADVPFFIFNHSYAIGKERGDNIRPINSRMRLHHVIVSLPVKVATKDIYDNYSLGLTVKKPNVKMFVRSITQCDLNGVKKGLYNSLEYIVNKRVTHISRIKNFFKEKGFDAVQVTGSGPTVFALTKGRKEALSLKSEFEKYFLKGCKNGCKVFVAETLIDN